MSEEDIEARLDRLLASDDAERERRYPPAAPVRQPVHTVYVAADRFDTGTISQWGAQALAVLDEHGPLPAPADLGQLVRGKLASEPIEDLRIDFEDGYGLRPDDEEDADARAAAAALASITPPAFCGIRVKSLEPATRIRSIRTLGLFLEGLASVPEGFRITLPKVTSVVQVTAMIQLCEAFEQRFGLGALRFEIQIETPQAVLGAGGVALIAPMLREAGARCAGLHYGTYDYSASVGVAAHLQSMEHPAADYAKSVMQVAAAGTGVPVSDGSTNILPVGDRDQVRAGWDLHLRLVRRSLDRGFYQGWDLHPAQLPTRYAATFAFYREGMAAAVDRLTRYLTRESSGILDEPATARALAGFLIRGLECGAFALGEIDSSLDADTLNRLARLGV